MKWRTRYNSLIMKDILNYLFEHKRLSEQQAYEVLLNISKGNYNPSEMAAFMTVYLMRSISVQELIGFRKALLELCKPIDLSAYNTMDIVGTGGDGKNTFNISTASCFVVAGAGVKVSKHGSYGVSSVSGASNAMETLGYKFKSDQAQLQAEIEQAGICFLHAPLFHPALKNVAPIRKQLGVRTFFNIMGPLINPAAPNAQMLGVYSLEVARIYNYLFQQTANKFAIVYSLDGYDEISLTADTRVITQNGEGNYTPEDLHSKPLQQSELYGGRTVKEAAKLFLTIIKGEGTPGQSSVIKANAAMALKTAGCYDSFDACYQAATESLASGKAYEVFKKLIAIQ